MNPDLVCKITAQTSTGPAIGTGYPIQPNRIITAAHVVQDALRADEYAEQGDARQITLAFPHQKEAVEGPVFLEWSGVAHGVDVAVLRCALPDALRPSHRLLLHPPETPIPWFAQGYTQYGRATQQHGKGDYQGTLTTWSIQDATVPLVSHDGPIDPERCKGGSGSVAFDHNTPANALVVITEYQGGTKLDRLVAVPICYLLNAGAMKDAFRQAIDFKAYQQRENYCNKVIDVVASELQALDEVALEAIATSVSRLLAAGASGIGLKSKQEELARQTAACMVERAHLVDDVIGLLVTRMQGMQRDQAVRVARIVDHLLPLNYAPQVIDFLQDQVKQNKLGLVGVNHVATLTIAEIIMAGFDQKPATFVTVETGDDRVRGRPALVPLDGPEEGFDVGADLTIKREVRNFLLDLIACKDATLSGVEHLQSRPTAEVRSESNLDQDITRYAAKLRGSLRAVRQHYENRTIYCVLKPLEEPSPQAFRHKVLEQVHKHVPSLVFVELVPWNQVDDREFEIEQHVDLRVRLIHAYQNE